MHLYTFTKPLKPIVDHKQPCFTGLFFCILKCHIPYVQCSAISLLTVLANGLYSPNILLSIKLLNRFVPSIRKYLKYIFYHYCVSSFFKRAPFFTVLLSSYFCQIFPSMHQTLKKFSPVSYSVGLYLW